MVGADLLLDEQNNDVEMAQSSVSLLLPPSLHAAMPCGWVNALFPSRFPEVTASKRDNDAR